VFLIGVGIDENVIDVNDYPMVKHVLKDVIDEGLKYGSTVGKPEVHNQIFIVPSAVRKGCFPFITLPDAKRIKGIAEVLFEKLFGIAKLF